MTTERILFISNHGQIVGGGEISLLSLMTALDRAKWNPLLVVPEEGRLAQEARAAGISTRIIPMPSPNKARRTLLRSIRDLRALILDHRIDLVHANGSRAMIFAGLAAFLADKPVIWHVRVADPDGWLDRALARLATRIIVNSDAVRHRFAWVSDDKVCRIHNGIDTERFVPRPAAPASRAAVPLSPDDHVVVSIGRFVPYKGYDRLLEAAALLRKSAPDLHWVLVGDGELRDHLIARCTELGLTGRVHFTGWVEDVRDVLALADIFVLPSLGEHFGRVLVEAMAMGKPVVATSGGGVPEIVLHEETGLLVPPADPKTMADAVRRLLDRPDLARHYGLAGRRRAETHFSLRSHVTAVTAVYSELIGACCAPV